MTLTTGLLVLGALWVLGAVFIAGLCHTASRRRPTEVLIPEVARRSRWKRRPTPSR